MAKRRINQRFLALLGGSFVALAALGIGALKFRNVLFPKHPEKFLAAGRLALANKDYVSARDNLTHAAALSHPDAALNVMIGDALNGLASKDPDNVAAARSTWEQALTIDAGNVDAMQRLVQFWRDQLDLRPHPADRAQIAQQLQKAADRLLVSHPTDHFGRANSAEATVEAIVDGAQKDPALVTAAQQTLSELRADDPADADLPYYIARGYIWQSQEAARAGHVDLQSKFLASAIQVMADASAAEPDNASIRYRWGGILLQIAAADTNGADPAPETKETMSQAAREIDAARQLVKPDDPRYVEINLFDARLTLNRPDYAPPAPPAGARAPISAAPTTATAAVGAVPVPVGSLTANEQAPRARTWVMESIYRDVLSHRPNDVPTRLALADLLGNLPGRRDEAISMLRSPLVDDHPEPGIRGTLQPFYQSQANIRLLSLEMDAAEASRDQAKRPALVADADALCERVYGRSPDSPQVLGLKGRLELLHGQVVEATQTLRRALALTDAHDKSQKLARYELIYNLARACEAAQQTGDAKKMASEVVANFGHFIPARLMLARLLITEHDSAGAKPQIDFLESILPTHPELAGIVSRMRIATLDPVQDAKRIKQYYDTLAEATRDQRMDKAAFARLVKYDGEVVRLLALVHAAAPGDSEAARGLSALYETNGEKQKAIQVLNEALAANPADSGLLAFHMQMQSELQDGAPQALADTTQPVAGDPFYNEWAQVQIDRSHGDLAGVDAHLMAAEKLKPNEPRIWDAIFTRSLESSNWDRASAYLEKLASANIDHAGGVLYRVRFYLARNDTQKAGDLALQLTRDKPEFSQSWSVLGQVQKAEGKYQEAVASFLQALERQTQNVEAIHGIIDCSYASANPEQAKRYIDMGRRVAPGNESFKELAITYELNYGDPQNVIPTRLAQQQAAPDDQQALLSLADAYATAARSRAKAQDAVASADYFQKAATVIQSGIAKWPDSTNLVILSAKLSVERGDFPGAEQVMLNFAQQPSEKGRPRAATLLGEFYELAGKPDQAVKVLSDYLAQPFQPTDAAADVKVEIRLAVLLVRVKRFDEALAALSANAQNPAIIRQKVETLIEAGRLADSQKLLSDLAAAAPLSPDLLSLKGVSAFDAGNVAEAKSCFDQVIAAQPNDVYALTQRAQIAMRDVPPDYGLAATDLTRARDLAPQDMETRLLLVDADNRRGRSDDAIAELESAIHFAPQNKRVRLELIDLYARSNPPRWDDADRIVRATDQIPALADDADVMHEEAAVDLGQGELTKADALIRSAMAKAPTDLSIVHTYYDILLRTKEYDQLLAHSAQVLASTQNAPALWWVYPYRAQAFVKGTGDKASAKTELENGLAAVAGAKDLNGSSQIIQAYSSLLGPDAALKAASTRAQSDPHWLVLAATICRQRGDADSAISWLEMALAHFDKLGPTDQDQTLRLAAQEYLAKASPDPLKSADMYRRLNQRSPDDFEVLNNLACILVEPGPAYQPHEALDDSEKAYNLMMHAGRDEPMVKDTYGWTLIANGRSEEGLGLVQNALGKRDFAGGHYHLAEALLKRQPPSAEDAASELTKAMQLLEQDERDGKPIDVALKSHVQEELKRTRDGLAG